MFAQDHAAVLQSIKLLILNEPLITKLWAVTNLRLVGLIDGRTVGRCCLKTSLAF